MKLDVSNAHHHLMKSERDRVTGEIRYLQSRLGVLETDRSLRERVTAGGIPDARSRASGRVCKA